MQVEVLRVFADDRGDYGNPLGVVFDGASVPETARRQQLAATLGFSETIFIDDAERGRLRIFTPATELPFAGHPTVGPPGCWPANSATRSRLWKPRAVWSRHGLPENRWVRGSLAATPPWWHERLADSAAVDALDGPLNPAQDATQVWAWRDEPAGVLRARVFAARYGVAEDEACGSTSMRLAAVLDRDITVHHGRGSIVYARPGPPGTAEIGGRVISDGVMPGALG